MNKYQQAFDRTFNYKTLEEIREDSHNNDTITHLVYDIYDQEIFFEDIVLFKGLVDKATPMKPVNGKCPGCHETHGLTHDILEQDIDYDYEENMKISYSVREEENDFCSNCGQALDWSKDEIHT